MSDIVGSTTGSYIVAKLLVRSIPLREADEAARHGQAV